MEIDNDLNKPSQVDENQDSVLFEDQDGKAQGVDKSVILSGIGTVKEEEARAKSIPPPGTGQRIYEIDPFLKEHHEHLDYR